MLAVPVRLAAAGTYWYLRCASVSLTLGLAAITYPPRREHEVTTAKDYPITITDGATTYTVDRAEGLTGSDDGRPSFYLLGKRGARYLMAPVHVARTNGVPTWSAVNNRGQFLFFATVVGEVWATSASAIVTKGASK